MNNEIVIYTDGACKGNPGPGGWAYYLFIKSDPSIKVEDSGHISDTTNNRMELMAVIMALKKLKKSCKVTLHTDSQYVKNGCELWMANWKKNEWKGSNKKEILNTDLWKELDSLLQLHSVSFVYVKAHNGDRWNEYADKLASDAATTPSEVNTGWLQNQIYAQIEELQIEYKKQLLSKCQYYLRSCSEGVIANKEHYDFVTSLFNGLSDE